MLTGRIWRFRKKISRILRKWIRPRKIDSNDGHRVRKDSKPLLIEFIRAVSF